MDTSKDAPREEVFYTSEQIRRGTRADDRWRARRQKTGNRVFQNERRKEEFARQTLAAQLEVLQTRQPGDPLYDNVYRGMERKYGAQVQAMIEAEA